MLTPADRIYAAVLAAMQDAEELGGPEGGDYLNLMERIAAEATQRAATYRAVPDVTTIQVFEAWDGRWSYAPQAVRNDPAFCCEGEFEQGGIDS